MIYHKCTKSSFCLLHFAQYLYSIVATIRLVKRLYIPLPEGEARRKIIKNLLANERHHLKYEEIEEVVKKTEGYSGADMANLVKEAAMGPIRDMHPNMLETIDAKQVLLQLVLGTDYGTKRDSVQKSSKRTLTPLPSFSENHITILFMLKKPCLKVQNLPLPLELFRKFIRFGTVTRPSPWKICNDALNIR